MINKFHKFHIVNIRPWPIVRAITFIRLSYSATIAFQFKSQIPLLITSIIIILTAFQWWRDIARETSFQGNHHSKVITGLKLGILLFIASEVLFFISFFWSYFHRRISPNIEIGQNWPPNSVKSFNPINVPILNTIILLASGVSVTWRHHQTLKNELGKAKTSLLITRALGIYFSFLQGLEYNQSEFSINDSVYGAIFFIATGFHGIHVLIGSIFLITCLIRIKNLMITSNHLIGMEIASWYWHFVDVVWLFLYVSIYWWGYY